MTFISDIVSKYVHESHVSAIKEMAMRSAQVPDSVSLSWGLPSFRTPEYIRNGVKSLLDTDEDVGKYTFPDGLLALRELVARTHYQKTGLTVDANRHVMINAGNMQGLNTLFHTMLDPGDEIILTDPVSHRIFSKLPCLTACRFTGSLMKKTAGNWILQHCPG